MAITSEKGYQDALSELHSMIECPIDGLYDEDIEKLTSEMHAWEEKNPLKVEENESHKAQLQKLGFWDNYRP